MLRGFVGNMSEDDGIGERGFYAQRKKMNKENCVL